MKNQKKKQWETLESETVFSSSLFKFHIDKCRVFDGRVMPKYFKMEFPDWVQVVALDTLGNVIMVSQYRYAGQDWFLEFPGGSVNSLDIASETRVEFEDPLVAAQRELLEETGYSSEDWQPLGHHFPNPALQTNRCHIYVARNCKKVADMALDAFEELVVELVPATQLASRLSSGENVHSLMLATWALFINKTADSAQSGS